MGPGGEGGGSEGQLAARHALIRRDPIMTTIGKVQSLNINDLKKYSPEARVNLPLIESKDLVTRMNCYEPGQVTPFHVHPNDDEVIYCIEGRGAITFADRPPAPMTPGTVISLPAGLPHGIEAAADSRMVVIYTTNAGYTSERPEARAGEAEIALPGEKARY
jgi:quercetin dioxygenase-like cupin family protein